MHPQSLNRYAYVDNNPATLDDPLGLEGFNPLDPCNSSIWYADSHAECGPLNKVNEAMLIYCGDEPALSCLAPILQYPGGTEGGNGPGFPPQSPPPAGQPPLAGSANPLVSDTGMAPGPCVGPDGIILYPQPGMPCFKIIVLTSSIFGGWIPWVPSQAGQLPVSKSGAHGIPISYGQSVVLRIGCFAGLSPDLVIPVQAPTFPQDPTESTDETKGQSNPEGEAAANAAAYLSNVFRCLGNVWTWYRRVN